MVACDSAGTASYHTGELADERMRKTALTYGIKLTHRARTLVEEDWKRFDYIVVMDKSNWKNAERVRPNQPRAAIHLMREFDKEAKGKDVPDPWYGDMEGFDECYRILDRSCNGFLQFLSEKHQWK